MDRRSTSSWRRAGSTRPTRCSTRRARSRRPDKALNGRPASCRPPTILAEVKATFFATPGELREWLERNHATATEVLVGFYKRGSGKPSITWQGLVDEELCFRWIDGGRQGSGEVRDSKRITPRTPSRT